MIRKLSSGKYRLYSRKKDPKTGKWLDETRHLIEAFDWLSAAEKKMIFEDNAKKVFKLEVGAASSKGVAS